MRGKRGRDGGEGDSAGSAVEVGSSQGSSSAPKRARPAAASPEDVIDLVSASAALNTFEARFSTISKGRPS